MKHNIHLIGNAHLDPTWLWRWQEGCGEVLQTFRSAVDRLHEYDDFIFTCSSACYYKWVEDIDPSLFEEIRELVKQGRWVPVNGWWVQPDCNMPCAESFARQALYSQLYYYEKFGKICRTGYNVDSFGHNAMIPQLLTKGGMRCYVMMRPNNKENPEIPEDLFWWDSADGSRVLTYRIPTGYAETGKNAIDRAKKLLSEKAEKNGHGMMLFYGVGNHGGGPTKGDIEYLKSLKENGCEELKFSSPDEYFKSVCALPLEIPSWNDELQHHASGCYSATSLIKQLNRKAENALINAEKWASVSCALKGRKMPTEFFKDAWLKVCYNQFHDILCGCSIREAYEDASHQLGYSVSLAADKENEALQTIAADIDTWIDGVSDSAYFNERHHCENHKFPRAVAVFNPLSFPVKTTVRAYHPSCEVKDSDGNRVLFSNVRSSRSNDSHLDTVFEAEIPAMGYSVYHLRFKDENNSVMPETDIDAGEYYMENSALRVEFSKETGGIKSIISKRDGKEYLGEESFIPTVIDNSKPDTWAHNIFKFHDIIGKMKLASIQTVECSGARAVIRVKHEYGKSYLSQDYILDTHSEFIRVKARILWQEPLTILKMPVTIAGSNPVSTYEIPGGFIKRPCNGEEEPALTWADVTASGSGITIFSDSKYSYDCPGNTLRLTMLRNSIFADHYSDRPDADFSYCDDGLQRFEYGIYPHNGESEKSKAGKYAAMLNNKPSALALGYHKGSLPQKKSFISIDKPNIEAVSFKACEDSSGDFILRVRETSGIPVKAAIVCDIVNAGFYADFNRQEIKTFRIDSEGYVKETDFLEGIVR